MGVKTQHLDGRARAEFDKLSRNEVVDAISDMKALGFSDCSVAAATGLSIESVRQMLAERRGARR